MGLLPAVFVLAAQTLTGCGTPTEGGDAPSAWAPEDGPLAGQCFAGSEKDLNDLGPDYATKVACTEPHAWEITGTVALPKNLLDTTTTAASQARRAELGTFAPEPTTLQKRFNEVTARGCRTAVNEMTGLGELEMGKDEPAEGYIRPQFGNASEWITVMTEPAWVGGRFEAVCSVVFQDANGDPRQVRSSNGKPLTASYLTNAFPPAERFCLEEEIHWTRCDGSHAYERLWTLDAAGILESDRNAQLSEQDTTFIHLVCNLAYKDVVGALPADHLTMLSVALPDDPPGWRSCIVRDKELDKPLEPGFTDLASSR